MGLPRLGGARIGCPLLWGSAGWWRGGVGLCRSGGLCGCGTCVWWFGGNDGVRVGVD